MSKVNSYGAFLLFCYLDFQLKSLRCGYKIALIYNSRSSGLTWAFHFLWEMSMHYPPAGKRWEKEKHDSRPWGAPEASARFPHSPHTRCLLREMPAQLELSAGLGLGQPVPRAVLRPQICQSQFLIWRPAAVAFLQKYYAFPTLCCQMQGFLHTGFLFCLV